MLSTQFLQSKNPPQHHQSQLDLQTLFLSLSGLNLTNDSSTSQNVININDTGILAACLFPSAQNVVFGHSSFFRQNQGQIDLPTPEQIRQEAARLSLSQNQAGVTHVPIPSLKLLVKYGPTVTSTEAKNQLLLRRLLPKDVPVLEVFGWRKDADDTFIYMSLPESGIPLSDAWPLLSEDQKTEITTQLRQVVRSWRRLRQNNSTRTRVESIDQTPLHDTIFTPTPSTTTKPGPFPDVPTFHTWFVQTAMSPPPSTSHTHLPSSSFHFQPNAFFQDKTPILFTHASLHPSNILISTTTPNPSILAILDWSQAGWYPAYWEFCKARRACNVGSGSNIAALRDWEGTYMPWILDDEKVGIKKWGGTVLCHYWDYFVGLFERRAASS
ncbi:hypothetical protein QBC47DRAFT_409804 [Echria macrotheca]|uniref:Aminoglycoside phosphotransferase domain-containing protein n=1 Tax=Echria macrotheca TaxID=438768 RepID=A0AAJ0BIP1_9PEZI|nr:hypothetical protein QBC47DRAFT_409804 [Echria macrotheca]